MQSDKTRPAIICLGGGIESLPIIRHIDSLGYLPIVLDLYTTSPGHQWATSTNRGFAWQADVYNPRSVLSTVSRVMNHSRVRSPIAGVLCTATDTPDSQAILAKKFRLPSIGVESAELAKDKWKQYDWLMNHNIPVPPTRLVDASTPAEEVSRYDIVKPVVGRGARGVTRFTPETYRESLLHALSQAPVKNRKAIVQKFLPGDQLSTESVIQSGQILFTAVALRNYSRANEFYPHIIEDGVDAPHWLGPEHFRNLNNLILRAALCLGWDNCTVKGDVAMSSGAFFLIELAPRLSGGYFCSHTIPWAYEYDFIKSAVNLAVDRKNGKREEGERSFVCQRYLFPRPEWIGKTIKALPSPPAVEGNVFISIHRKPGDKIGPVVSHADRLGQVTVRDVSAGSADVICNAIVADVLSRVEVQ